MSIQKVNRLNPQELNQVVNLHKSILKESFINHFGGIFLKTAYRTIVKSENNIFFLVKEKNEVTAFMVATFDGSKFNQDVIRANFFRLGFEILKASLKKPFLILLLIQWVFTPTPKKLPQELQFIAVSKKYQNKGIGTSLLNKLYIEFKKRNLHYFRVGTKANNKLSNNFYKKNGFKFDYSTQFFGDKFNYYISPTF